MSRRILVLLGLAALAACTTGPIMLQQPRAVVFFTADSAGLDAPARTVIANAAARANDSPGATVRVLGFAAPDTGTAAFNRILAQARAQAVADGLVADGVPQRLVLIQSRGAVPYEQMPTESRRVEILVGG